MWIGHGLAKPLRPLRRIRCDFGGRLLARMACRTVIRKDTLSELQNRRIVFQIRSSSLGVLQMHRLDGIEKCFSICHARLGLAPLFAVLARLFHPERTLPALFPEHWV